ncbi:nuclear transport factor 2 family protein [Mycolicibacterium thermoresistibile]
MQMWELVARERIRDTLAGYNWAGDAARIAELTQTFCADGELEVRGMDTVRGRAGIAAFLGGVADPAGAASADAPPIKRIVRHNLTNIRFVEVTPERVRVESYFTVLTEIGLDHYGRYRDVFVPVGEEWLIQRRFVATDWAASESTMARARTSPKPQ